MPFAINDGIKIHYEVHGEGPTLVMRHGLGYAVEDWHILGYTDALKSAYRLVQIDARGHGQSDRPSDPALCSHLQMAEDVVAVMDALNVDKAIYYGYSQGAATAFPLVSLAADRIGAFVLVGGSPYRPASVVQANEQRLERLKEGGMEAYVRDMESRPGDSPMPLALRTRYLRNDVAGLGAVVEALMETPDNSHLIPLMTQPTLVVAGELNPGFARIRGLAGELREGRFVSLHGLTHRHELERTDLVLPPVISFLDEVVARARVGA